jgi:hypothetical protein
VRLARGPFFSVLYKGSLGKVVTFTAER